MDKAIAIVGMSSRFAGCSTPGALWDAVMRRRSLLTVPGADSELPPGQANVFKRPYPVRLGQLGELYACVPAMQNFPRQVNAGENQDLYFATQLAFDALADASIRVHSRMPIRGSVRLGYAPPFNAATVNWLQHTAFLDQTLDILRRFLPQAPAGAMAEIKSHLVDSLPAPDAASFLLGSGYRLASWIARECSFAGSATILDAGVLTGAAVLRDAIADLDSLAVDVALAGALTPPLDRAYLEGLSGEVEFSTHPELQPYAESSDGTIPGEGGAFFVLKRRADALRDHDRIYALVRAVAIGHDADDSPGSVFAEAAASAGVPVTSIGLIEGDGTGIGIQETREIAMLQHLWGSHRPGGPLVGLGSIKGNVGHTLRASMAAGLVKAALALHHRVLPPQVAPERPAAPVARADSSVYLLEEARPWISGDSANVRRAAVYGANFDAVAPVRDTAAAGRSAVILLEEEPEDRK